MKRFADMTDDEVVALDESAVSTLVDLECAHAGVPLTPPEPAPLVIASRPRAADVSVFSIGDVHFTSEDDAKKVRDLAASLPRVTLEYAPDGSYKNRIVKPTIDEVEIARSSHFSAARWNEVKAIVHAATEQERAYSEARKACDGVAAKRKAVEQPIRDRIDRVAADRYRRERWAREMVRYLALASGDEAVARNFLLLAHPEAAEYLPGAKPAASVPAPLAPAVAATATNDADPLPF